MATCRSVRATVLALLAARVPASTRAWASVRARSPRPSASLRPPMQPLVYSAVRTDAKRSISAPDRADRRHLAACCAVEDAGLPAAGLSVTAPSAADIQVLQRQLGHNLSSVWAISPRCSHGFPQAFVWDPLRRHSSGKARRMHLDSGLFRLSCPLLVQAIDEWEGEGGVKAVNAEVRADEAMQEQLAHAHRGHSAARKEVIGERIHGMLSGMSAELVDTTHLVLRSGIAGQSLHKSDVKCLHAQVADSLCRSGCNQIGQLLVERLRRRGVDVGGSALCSQQCDPAVPPAEAAFWYTPQKNRWKLRKKIARRRAQRLGGSAWLAEPVDMPS